MIAIKWVARAVTVLFVIVILNGWQHGHYPFAFVMIILVGVLAAFVSGYADACTEEPPR